MTSEVCRYCLKTVTNYTKITSSQKDMSQILFHKWNLENTTDFICSDCDASLQEGFSFKCKCLEIEDNIYNYVTDELKQINLEKIMGLEPDVQSDIKICRTCLELVKCADSVSLNNNNWLLQIFKEYLPELDVEVTQHPVICQKCNKSILKISVFCLQSIKSDSNFSKTTDLSNVAESIEKNQESERSQNVVSNEENIHTDVRGINIDSIAKKIKLSLQKPKQNLRKPKKKLQKPKKNPQKPKREIQKRIRNSSPMGTDCDNNAQNGRTLNNTDLQMNNDQLEVSPNKRHKYSTRRRKGPNLVGFMESEWSEDDTRNDPDYNGIIEDNSGNNDSSSDDSGSDDDSSAEGNPQNQVQMSQSSNITTASSQVDSTNTTTTIESGGHQNCLPSKSPAQDNKLEYIFDRNLAQYVLNSGYTNPQIAINAVKPVPTHSPITLNSTGIVDGVQNFLPTVQVLPSAIETPAPPLMVPLNQKVEPGSSSFIEAPKNPISNDISSQIVAITVPSTVVQEKPVTKISLPEETAVFASQYSDFLVRRGPNIMYYCDYCGHDFKDVESAKDHILVCAKRTAGCKYSERFFFEKRIAGRTVFVCICCQRQFELKNDAKRHVAICHVKDTGASEAQKQQSEAEEDVAKRLTVFKCDACAFNSRLFQTIVEHATTHFSESSANSFKCGACGHCFNTARSMYDHIYAIHRVAGYKKFYWCINCELCFSSSPKLDEHLRQCKSRNVIHLFRSNNMIFCMNCGKYECTETEKAKNHLRACSKFKRIKPKAEASIKFNAIKPKAEASVRLITIEPQPDASVTYNTIKPKADASVTFSTIEPQVDASVKFGTIKPKADASVNVRRIKPKAEASIKFRRIKPKVDPAKEKEEAAPQGNSSVIVID